MTSSKGVSDVAINGNAKEKIIARNIIKYIGEELGKALAALAAASYDKDWQLERIVIGSALGEKMGKDSKGNLLKTEEGKDFYFYHIRESCKKELISHFNLPKEFASAISAQVVRSPITQDERETAGFDRS